MATSKTLTSADFDYRTASNTILKSLRRDRDRQIIARRFGFDLPARQTLEQIGRSFGITRERVRQIEKTTLIKVSQMDIPEITRANQLLKDQLDNHGAVAPIGTIAAALQAAIPAEQAYIAFLATLAPDITVIDEDEHLRGALAITAAFTADDIRNIAQQLIKNATEAGHPQPFAQLSRNIDPAISPESLLNIASLSKQLAHHDDSWGLIGWPEVNPKSIRDKTYLVLTKHGKPMHFSEISEHIKSSNFSRRDVTVQAVHNELIKDSRFILIGRGIYALAEWGYTPGTVADIIIDVLKEETPLHKDEIVKRVLKRRQVKTTTIILNLQEKDHFVRVAKATYKLKGQ